MQKLSPKAWKRACKGLYLQIALAGQTKDVSSFQKQEVSDGRFFTHILATQKKKKGGLLVMFVTPYTAIYTEIPATGSQLPCKADTLVIAIKILP